jgi:hypothetical protein
VAACIFIDARRRIRYFIVFPSVELNGFYQMKLNQWLRVQGGLKALARIREA